jgi:hypothetical protein
MVKVQSGVLRRFLTSRFALVEFALSADEGKTEKGIITVELKRNKIGSTAWGND